MTCLFKIGQTEILNALIAREETNILEHTYKVLQERSKTSIIWFGYFHGNNKKCPYMCGQSLNLSQNQTSSKHSAHTPHFPTPEFDLEAQPYQCVTEKEETGNKTRRTETTLQARVALALEGIAVKSLCSLFSVF